jgi:hypothetical protein
MYVCTKTTTEICAYNCERKIKIKKNKNKKK